MRDDGHGVRSRFWLSSDLEVSAHHFQYSPNHFDCLPHTHAEYNVTFCLDDLEQVVEGRTHALEPGDVLVVNPGEVHNGRYGTGPSPSHGLTLAVTERALHSVLEQMRFPGVTGSSRVLLDSKRHDPRVVHITRELLAELEARRSGYELVVRSLIPQMLVYLLRNALEPRLAEPGGELPRQLPSWQMVQAIEYMNSRGKSHFSLVELCSQVGSSPSRFIRLFKNSARTTPHEYFNHLVVNKARALLRIHNFSIKGIANELGFQNDAHFCTVFRRVCGTTPKAFRLLEMEKAHRNPPV